MARVSFTAPERGALLARAVLAEANAGTDDKGTTAVADLAEALLAGNGREFDDLLVAHYRDVALEAAGLAPAQAEPADPVPDEV